MDHSCFIFKGAVDSKDSDAIEDDTELQNSSFLCHPCSKDKPGIHAEYACKICKEFYCTSCSQDHKRLKVTKSHVLNSIHDKQFCGSCSDKDKPLSQYCADCDEAQCDACAKAHNKFRAARTHVLILPDYDVPQLKKANAGQTLTKKVSPSKDTSVENMKPGKPYVGSKTLDNIVIKWTQPRQRFKDCGFQLRYRENKKDVKWRFAPEAFPTSTGSLRNLQSGTKYVFQVRMVDNESEGPYSELSDPVETIVSAAERQLPSMRDMDGPKGGMKLKKLPFNEFKNGRNTSAKTRKLYIGQEDEANTKERTILLIGATGTGKSTLVDGMMNYILGVKWEDNYRLVGVELEADEKKKKRNQAESQTEWITAYEIRPLVGGRLNYKLTIIDTPGFGDTRGISRDKKVVDQLHQLFKRSDKAGVPYIDAVCFIVKAPDARLTPTQKYIFDSIMSLFGKDIENNILTLITFADGKDPPVLAALKEAKLPHTEYYVFNNSGLWANNTGSADSGFASMFWNMGCASFDKFFERLAQMETKSLCQTKDVLRQRETIENRMESLVPLLNKGLAKVEDIRREIKVLVQYNAQIKDNSDFKYTVEESRVTQVPTPIGRHTTTCLTCNFTCHSNCAYANDDDKKNCVSMNIDGYCKVCPNGCIWNLHKNVPYYFEIIKVPVEKTYSEKLKLFKIAKDDKAAEEKVLKKMHDAICTIEYQIYLVMKDINDCNNRLRRIALRPDRLGLVDHIDILIASEKQEKRPDYLSRIQSLEECRKRATIDHDVSDLNRQIQEAKVKINAEFEIFSW